MALHWLNADLRTGCFILKLLRELVTFIRSCTYYKFSFIMQPGGAVGLTGRLNDIASFCDWGL